MVSISSGGTCLATASASLAHPGPRPGATGGWSPAPAPAPIVPRRTAKRPGLHAPVAVLRGTMGAGAGAGDRPPVAPGRGPGWAKLAEAVGKPVPPERVVSIHL